MKLCYELPNSLEVEDDFAISLEKRAEKNLKLHESRNIGFSRTRFVKIESNL